MRWFRVVGVVAVALLFGGVAQGGPRVLDDFSQPNLWKAQASDGVTGTSRAQNGALRLDYDFSKGSGYAFLRRELPLELPDNFELSFRLRGGGAANALELKLVDASGDNVWWHRKADYVAPGEWTTIRVKRRQIDFAWGPTEDKVLRRAAAVEFVVAAGSGGGKGWIEVDDLTLTPLPTPPAIPPAVIARADVGRAMRAVDRDRATAWTGTTLDLDLGYAREFGGLVLHWQDGAHASAYDVQLSGDGRAWRTVRRVAGGDGGTDWLKLEEAEARYVRLAVKGRAALAEVEVQPLAFGAGDNAFVSAVAKAAPRGNYPRGFIAEQNYWTLVATAQGGESGLIDESGAIEVARSGFSVEPFVVEDGTLTSWAEVVATQTLRDGDLPMPRVDWRHRGWSLRTSVFAEPTRLIARYALRNEGKTPRDLSLVLAVRPFQVNPPQQFLNIRGGVSPIRTLRWAGGDLHVNGAPRLRPAVSPDEVRLAAFDAGPLPQSLGGVGSASPVEDATGLASGALVYRVRLAPGEERSFALAIPLGLGVKPTPLTLADAAEAEEATAARWRATLGGVTLRGPAAAEPVFATLRSALAQMLMTREGPALRPGSRAYARSWIRDGAMMSTALLRLGHAKPAADFLEWYAPYQYASGKVPCCVDPRGADPVPEHDSHGELIHLVAQLHRYAPDDARLARMWPRVRAAADHIETLRQSTRLPENRAGVRRAFYGLLPPSISHEGYSAKPMHSYWDDFWGLTGLKDAAWLAARSGRADEARLLTSRADAFRGDILASLNAAMAHHRIGFLPGAADLGDFDATSTTIALAPGGEMALLPQAALERTFERYWDEFEARRTGTKAWDAYTPYEWRNVGAFVRLGWRERTMKAIDFFMADRRPAGWNQWAEVVSREVRTPRFLGDMPHGWVASDFINAGLDMLAYERDGALVLAAGVPANWLADGGIVVERLRTPHGELTLRFAAENGKARLDYRLDGTPPPSGLVFGWPPAAGASARTAGRAARWEAGGVTLPGRSGLLEFSLR